MGLWLAKRMVQQLGANHVTPGRRKEKCMRDIPEHAQQPIIETAEEACHVVGPGHRGRHWLDKVKGGMVPPRTSTQLFGDEDADGQESALSQTAEPVESENGSAAGIAWLCAVGRRHGGSLR
jgi:hypothetical protein